MIGDTSPGVMGEYRCFTVNGLERAHLWNGEKWELILFPKDYEVMYTELRSAVVDYLSHPSADGSKERLRKREILKGMVS